MTSDCRTVLSVIDISELDPSAFDHLSDSDERRRASTVRGPRRRRMFVAARAITKLSAAAMSGVPARRFTIVGGPGKKPRFTSGTLELSISHSWPWVGVAVSESSIGIDVQKPVVAALHARLPAAERAWIDSLPLGQKIEAATSMWVRHESMAKLGGDGLRFPLSASTNDVASPEGVDQGVHWRRYSAPGFVACAASANPGAVPTQIVSAGRDASNEPRLLREMILLTR